MKLLFCGVLMLSCLSCRTATEGSQTREDEGVSNSGLDEHGRAEVFARLKDYRTYYRIINVQPYAHQFAMTFNDVDQTFVTMSGNTVEEFESISSVSGATGGLFDPLPADEPAPLPLQPLEEAARKKIKELYPNLRNLKVRYDGEFRSIDVVETIPMNEIRNTGRRFAYTSRVALAEKKGEAGLSKAPSGFNESSWGVMCGITQPCDEANFIDYQLPPELEARAPLAYMIFGPDGGDRKAKLPDMEAELQRLFPIIQQTANAIDQGTYQSPIEDILARQVGALPPDLNLFFEVGMSCSTKLVSDPDKRPSERGGFSFTFDQLKNGLRLEGDMSTFGFHTTFEGNMDQIKMSVSNGVDKAVTQVFDIVIENPMTGNGSIGPQWGSIDLVKDVAASSPGSTIPGFGDYGEFSCSGGPTGPDAMFTGAVLGFHSRFYSR